MATTPPFHVIYLDLVLGTIFCLIAIIGVLSNGLMGLHLCGLKKKFKTRTTSLLVQISAADFLTCLTVAPAVGGGLLSNRELPLWIGGSVDHSLFFANFTGWVSSAMNAASLYLICVLSVDRFYAVFYPISRPCILTTTRLTALCALSWLIPLFSNTYPLFRGAHFYYNDILGFYSSTPLKFSSADEQNVLYIWSNVSVLLPFCATVGFCLAVVSRLAQYRGRPKPGVNLELQLTGPQPVSILAPTTKKSSTFRRAQGLGRILSRMTRLPTSRRIRLGGGGPRRITTKRRSRNNDKHNIVTVIITLYILCLLPGILLNVFELLATFNLLPERASLANLSDKMLSMYLYVSLIFSTLLFTLNSCVNPFIYYFRCNPIFILPTPISRLLSTWKLRFQSIGFKSR